MYHLKLASLFYIVLVSFYFVGYSQGRGVNGGLNCAVCTVVTGLVQQTAYLRGVSLFNAARHFCKQLPAKIQDPCYHTVNKLEPFLADKRALDLITPDVFCYALRSCRIDPGEQFCHLFPKPHYSFNKTVFHLTNLVNEYNLHDNLSSVYQATYAQGSEAVKSSPTLQLFRFLGLDYAGTLRHIEKTNGEAVPPGFDFCLLPIFKDICDILNGKYNILHPAIDFDGDGFSLIKHARGSDWRGKDCNDADSSVYPGAQPRNLDADVDSNCNGIWGVDPESGRPWEDVLCGDSNPRGIVYVGDSVGAHFHFPERWMNPHKRDKSNLGTVVETILDEMDWPELGFATGFINTSHPELIQGVTDSLYLRLRKHDRCSHRDFQNIAKNGAMVWGALDQVNAVSRKPSDKPVLLIFAMVGNDVCNRFRDTVANMTTPEDFERLVLESLEELERKLPRGSHVVLLSLLDAGFIYPEMSERIHPLGTVLNNIHYKDLYSWFHCMEIGPCEGWMTPNATLRNITTQKSVELSGVLQQIAASHTFNSYKLHYLLNPFNAALQQWVDQGGELYKLIDATDSTHPNQLAQPLMAKALWNSLVSIGVIGPPNPHNDKIEELFGDQGGY